VLEQLVCPAGLVCMHVSALVHPVQTLAFRLPSSFSSPNTFNFFFGVKSVAHGEDQKKDKTRLKNILVFLRRRGLRSTEGLQVDKKQSTFFAF